MEAKAPTYDFYAAHGSGKLGEDEFRAALPDAMARVRKRAAHRSPSGLTRKEAHAWMMAACAACDALADPALKAWTGGKVREEYADPSSMTPEAAIDRHLAGTRLGEAWL